MVLIKKDKNELVRRIEREYIERNGREKRGDREKAKKRERGTGGEDAGSEE